MMVVEGYSEILPLAPDWVRAQATGRAFVFQKFEWVSHWMEVVGGPQQIEPLIIVVREGSSSPPLALVPLGIRTVFGVRILSVLGRHHADYTGAAVGEGWEGKEETNQMISETIRTIAIGKKIDLIWLQNIPQFIEDRLNPIWNVRCSLVDEASSVFWTRTWTEFYQERISTRVRADSRRQRKHLSNRGHLEFRIAETANEALQFTEAMIDQKSRRYKVTGVKNQFDRPENRNFYRKAIEKRKEIRPHVSALLIDNQIIASHWGEADGKRFYYQMPAYDERWEKYSPGRILLEHLIEWSFSSGYEFFDFTWGGENYKSHWANVVSPLYEYTDFLTLQGRLFFEARKRYMNVFRAKEVGRKFNSAQ